MGAGATGLTAGYELAKKGHAVTIFESSDRCGGLVDTFKAGELELERFYHHIFTSDVDIINLIEELGLGGSLMWTAPLNGIYVNEKLYPFTSPLDLLRFKELPFIDRVLMGLLVLRARLVKDWKRLENTGSGEWIVKNAGKKVLDKVWGPLLKSKFDSDADRVSAVWIWNKFKLRGSTRGKNLNRELLGYLKGSFGAVYRELAVRVRVLGGDIILSGEVTRIVSKKDETLEVTAGKRTWNCALVLVTTAPDILSEMARELPDWYEKRLGSIKYKSNICMILELKEKLSPYYWITVAQDGFPFVLVIEQTNLVSDKGYGSHIVYLSRYVDERNPLFLAPDVQVEKMFFEHLKKMFPGWDESGVKNTRIYRARYAQPVIVRDYSKIVPEYKTPIPNLYLACMAQIYPEDRGQNYAVRMGKEIAEVVDGS